jgi:hypothetical protein
MARNAGTVEVSSCPQGGKHFLRPLNIAAQIFAIKTAGLFPTPSEAKAMRGMPNICRLFVRGDSNVDCDPLGYDCAYFRLDCWMMFMASATSLG